LAANKAVIYLREIMFVSLNNNTTDVTSVAETSNPSKAPELIPVINGVRVFQFLDFCVVFCRSLFVLFRFTIALSALLRFTDSDYPLWDLQTLFNEHDVHKQ
jgi:hypothetical protein